MTSRVEFVDIDRRGTELSLSMVAGGQKHPLWFRSTVPLSLERADALVPIGVLAGMRTGEPLVLPLPVSAQLLANLGRIQDIVAAFSDGELAVTSVDAEPAAVPVAPGRGIGSFFSGGVDAFYTLLKHQDELSHLVFLQGFDIFDTRSPRAAEASRMARATAAATGKQLVEIETNVREVTRRFCVEHLVWGPAMAGIGLLLQSHLARLEMASSETYATLVPWGSHPLLDPLWSTEALEIRHDGGEATRMDKVARIATWPTAMQHLRVCNQQSATQNCGTCEKCLRTMASLRLAGALRRCETLPDTLDLWRLATMPMADKPAHTFVRENLRFARQVGDWSLALALAWSLRPRPVRRARHRLGLTRSRLGRRLARG